MISLSCNKQASFSTAPSFTRLAVILLLVSVPCLPQGQPIKVWDACSGLLRATYRAYDDADEITAATTLSFTPDGSKLVAGYNKTIRIFNVARPGRDCRKIATYKKKQEGSIPGDF